MNTAIIQFFHMGGYGAYIWSAYGITLCFFGGLIAWCYLARQRLLLRLKTRINCNEKNL